MINTQSSNNYNKIYSDWKIKYHETFCDFSSIDYSKMKIEDLNNQIKKLQVKYRNIPGMIIEFDKNLRLIGCKITEDIGKIIERELGTLESNDNILHIYTYLYSEQSKKNWHYWLGIAKKDLRDTFKRFI